VFDNGVEMGIESVQNDPCDPYNIIMTLSSFPMGVVTVSYGDVAAPGTGVGLPNAVKNSNGLPAPRFGPLEVEGRSRGFDGCVYY
jgi:hypothetical protein